MLTFHRINSLNEVNFEQLFNDSLSSMDGGTYVWPANVTTSEQKYAYIVSLIESLPKKSLFLYKVVENNELDVSFVVCKLESGILSVYFGFVGYNTNMSKSWVYYTSTQEARQLFFDSLKITGITFNYLNTGSLGNKVTTMLGNTWNSSTDISTDILVEGAIVKGFQSVKGL